VISAKIAIDPVDQALADIENQLDKDKDLEDLQDIQEEIKILQNKENKEVTPIGILELMHVDMIKKYNIPDKKKQIAEVGGNKKK
jgi:hypothetical protein